MWLGGLPAIAERLAAALLRPLEDTAPEKSAVELGYIRALGRSEEGRDAILRLLREGPLLAHLAEDLYQSAAALAKARAATAHELQSKFLEEAAFTMSFGGMDSFFGGLEGLVGPPLPQLHEAMRREHCMSADSHLQFRSLNYGVQTTSNIEWLFVSSPDEASLERLRLSRWPPEQALLDASSAYNAAKVHSALHSACTSCGPVRGDAVVRVLQPSRTFGPCPSCAFTGCATRNFCSLLSTGGGCSDCGRPAVRCGGGHQPRSIRRDCAFKRGRCAEGRCGRPRRAHARAAIDQLLRGGMGEGG